MGCRARLDRRESSSSAGSAGVHITSQSTQTYRYTDVLHAHDSTGQYTLDTDLCWGPQERKVQPWGLHLLAVQQRADQHVFAVMDLAQASAQQRWPLPTALQQPLGSDPHSHWAALLLSGWRQLWSRCSAAPRLLPPRQAAAVWRAKGRLRHC